MKIKSININGFGKFKDKSISLSDGLNIVYGNNEAGKSTTHTFIKSMLFGMKRKRTKAQSDTLTKYLPWGDNMNYEGTLNFSYNDKEYQIHRIFSKDEPFLNIKNLTEKNKNIINPEMYLHRVLNNLSIDSFDNTISIGQLKTTQDKSIIDELHKFIANLNTSGNMNINIISAINFLKNKRDSISLNLKSDANKIYNKQLGNIKIIERELSNKNYDNKLPELLQKKASESRKINSNNDEIEELKQQNIEKKLMLESYGFTSKEDIDTLSKQANKIYFEYKPIMNTNKLFSNCIINVVLITTGIIFIVLSFLFLVVTYPDIATILNVNNAKYSLSSITSFILSLPFHPIILISIFICLGIILMIGDILLLFNNYQNINKSNEVRDVLADIFNQHINDDEVSEENMLLFKKHISFMKKISKSVDESEARINLLTNENNTLLKNQSDVDDNIKSQERLQYDVEQKYNELYNLKNESEKIKQEISNNENINKEIESIDLAIETINNVANDIQVMFGTHLNKSTSNYLSALTNNKYDSLNVDDNLNVTLNYEGKKISLESLSTGTIDQVYLALRLAISDIICFNKEKLPLLFDDCFAMYDNNRLKSTLEFLHNNIDTQIIIFSCHTREKELLSTLGLDFNYIEI